MFRCIGAGCRAVGVWEVSGAEVWAVGCEGEYRVLQCWGGGVWVFEGF